MENHRENRQWWVDKWLELLDSYRFKKRLERARIYAREGHILAIEFVNSQVIAQVQGSEPQPYQVKLSLTPFSDEDWQFVIESLAKKAIFSAQLLAGLMPDDIEKVFIENGLNIFPFSLADIQSRCTCPDKANPCKHIGAVYYQLADRFREDPFVLFQLRGRTKEEILLALRQYRCSQATESAQKDLKREKQGETNQKIAIKLKDFWSYTEPLDSSLVVINSVPQPQKITDILGNLPLPYNEAEAVKKYLDQAYKTASNYAIEQGLTN